MHPRRGSETGVRSIFLCRLERKPLPRVSASLCERRSLADRSKNVLDQLQHAQRNVR